MTSRLPSWNIPALQVSNSSLGALALWAWATAPVRFCQTLRPCLPPHDILRRQTLSADRSRGNLAASGYIETFSNRNCLQTSDSSWHLDGLQAELLGNDETFRNGESVLEKLASSRGGGGARFVGAGLG